MTAHRVGIMGGTFDPVHGGHLLIAHEVSHALELESVIFTPAAQPWHKPAEHLAPAADRVAMLELALADTPEFTLSTVDLERGGDTYTVDTLRDLESRFESSHPGETADWFFITGADALAGLGTWKSPEELLRRATFVGVSRPGHELTRPGIPDDDRVVLMQIQGTDISSSRVRELCADGQPLEGLVAPSVADYIRQHGLYRRPVS